MRFWTPNVWLMDCPGKRVSLKVQSKCLTCVAQTTFTFFSFNVGLKNSRSFLCLISAAAYEPVRDYRADHTYDNVLLECETALKVCYCT